MGIIKKTLKKIKNVFEQPQYNTNGNKFAVYNDLKAQEEINLNTLIDKQKQLRSDINSVNSLTNAIRNIADELITDKNIDPYFLLQAQADYFCGTCRFETSNTYLRRQIINIIRAAFLMGIAGMYKDVKLNNLQPVYITSMVYGVDGKLKQCRIIPLNVVLSKMHETRNPIKDEDVKGWRTLNEKECENLAIFQWGTMGYSAWINKWPFVKLQHLMLTIIIIHAFVFNKKWIYKLNNYTSITDEIKLFFDPTNPFIVNVGNMDDLTNRFTNENVGQSGNAADVIDYYNKLIGVYYHLMGRKINNDVKKERNITSEVEASQENYDVVQSDWLNQFEIFIEELKALTGMDVEIIEDEPNNEPITNDEPEEKETEDE